MATLSASPIGDTKNLNRIKTLNSIVVTKVMNLVADSWLDNKIYIRITQALRTYREQNELYKIGREYPGRIVTNARGGYSWHNFGLAFDFVILDALGQAVWDSNSQDWLRVVEKGEHYGLDSGFRWSKFPDPPHFQYHKGIPGLEQARKYYEKGGLAEVDSYVIK